MDLSKLKASKADIGAVLQLRHPETDSDLPGVTITLLGADSKKNKQIQTRKLQANLDRMAKGKKAQALNAERVSDERIEELAQLTVSWTGIELGGEALDCSVENAKRLYSDLGLQWIAEQVNEFISDRANFF